MTQRDHHPPTSQSGPDSHNGESGPAGTGTPPKPATSATRLFTMAMLILQAFVVLFAGLAAFGLRQYDVRIVLTVTWVAIVTCIFVAMIIARGPKTPETGPTRSALAAGWVIQIAMLIACIWIPLMTIVALTFAGLWIASIILGRRIDPERAERNRQELEFYRAQLAQTPKNS